MPLKCSDVDMAAMVSLLIYLQVSAALSCKEVCIFMLIKLYGQAQYTAHLHHKKSHLKALLM